MKVLSRFALDEDGVRVHFENRVHRQNVRLAEVLERVTKARSLFSRSFHHPNCAENVAAMKISFTGV